MQTGAPQIQKTNVKSVVLASILALFIAAVAIALVVRAGSKSESIQKKLGADKVFLAGASYTMAQDIQKNGPVLFPDLLKQQRGTVVYVQHLGKKSTSGWYAFSARAGDDIDCQVAWKAATRTFYDKCTGKSYNARGQGLKQFRVAEYNGRVFVKLN